MLSVNSFLNQNYEYLKKRSHERGVLFRDDLFPADNTSISLIKSNVKPYKIYWKRPHQICDNPKFIVDKIEPNDLIQGDTGNCWFLSALSALAKLPSYCQIVIPPNQTFSLGYAGIFHFRFWKFGEWVDVVIDDRLPVNEHNQLIYCQNAKNKNEFFGPLLEKAYAKLACCYEFLNSGDPTVAMTDLTGAVCETINIAKCRENSKLGIYARAPHPDDADTVDDIESLWIIINNSFNMNSLMSASINRKNSDVLDENGALPNGLIPNHSYSLIQPVEFKLDPSGVSKFRLLKLRNPQGDADIWNGEWNPKSRIWNTISNSVKDKHNLKINSNGEFYISLKDFVDNFQELDIAHINLDAFASYSNTFAISSTHWSQRQFYGGWRANHNAGGSTKFFWQNPQYLIEINRNQPLSSLIVSLMQPYSARLRYENNGNFDNSFKPIKFHVFKVTDESNLYDHKSRFKKFNENKLKPVDSSGPYVTQRDITKRFSLLPGHYVIIPSTLQHNNEINYLLRVFFDEYSCTDIRELHNN